MTAVKRKDVPCMFVIVPISRLHTEDSIALGKVTISSKFVLQDIGNITIDSKLYSIDVLNKNNIFETIENCFAIYHIDNNLYNNLDAEILLEQLIRPVDFVLDCLRLDLNSFGFHEQAIGTPGLYGGHKVASILNDDFELYQIIRGKAFYYNLSEGIGCDATGYSIDDCHILMQPRTDEVYIRYRGILHRLLKSIQTYDVNSCFAFLFSIIEGMDCNISDDFKTKKIRILSFISQDQKTFDLLSQQFYFYSKIVRTDIIHAGKSLHDLLPWKEIYTLLDDLYLLVVKFCTAAIDCGASSFLDLDNEISAKCDVFYYSIPTNYIAINEMPSTHVGTCSYFAELNNFNIDTFLKIGHALFVPKKVRDMIPALRELYEHGLGIHIQTGLDERYIKIDSSFPNFNLFSDFNFGEKSFTLWDVDVILITLMRGINIDGSFVILQDQFYWESNDSGFNFKFSCEFSDIICNTIQNSINYLILFESFKNDSNLPSKAGISSYGIRAAYFNPDDSREIYTVLGRVYGEYTESSLQYTPNLSNHSDLLYNYFCSSRTDEVFLFNKKALTRMAASIYFEDVSEKFLTLFDCLDMLYPTTHDGKKLIKRIATFSSETLIEKSSIVENLTNWRNDIRNPLFHGGKSIHDLNLTLDEAFSILDQIRNIFVAYCENVYTIGIHTFEDMKKAQTQRNKTLL